MTTHDTEIDRSGSAAQRMNAEPQAVNETTGNKGGQIAGMVGKIVLLLIALFLTLGPVVWTVYTALTPVAEDGTRKLSLAAFQDVFTKIDVARLFLNSVLVTALCAIGQMLTAALAGYAFAKLRFKGKEVLFGLILATMMIPMQVTIVRSSCWCAAWAWPTP